MTRIFSPEELIRTENFIGGQWVAPVNGQYFDNTTPVTGKVFCEVANL